MDGTMKAHDRSLLCYATGIRLVEFKAIGWDQVDLNEGLIALQGGETKNGRRPHSSDSRRRDMNDLPTEAKKERDAKWPESRWVFNRQGEQFKDFRWAWNRLASVPDLKFHELRRTAVRNMGRDAVPQVIRMKISAHKTDSMRYNIVHGDDIKIAKSLMQAGRQRLAPKNCARGVPVKATSNQGYLFSLRFWVASKFLLFVDLTTPTSNSNAIATALTRDLVSGLGDSATASHGRLSLTQSSRS